MGKATGFMEFNRKNCNRENPLSRVNHWNEFEVPLTEEERREQGARCMDCGVPFCQSGVILNGMATGCPLHNLIPEWNNLIYLDKWELGLERLLKTSNFPEFTSRVCPALCENACTCGLNGESVTVKANEKYLIEKGFTEGKIKANPPKIRTGKKVAIIGSGPSGLASADILNKLGHNVTVYEREDYVGGLMMYGIPNMKLEKNIIERRVNILKEEGVIFKTCINVGIDVRYSKLQKEYDAIIVAIGAKIYPKIDCKLKLSIPNNPPINPIIPFTSAINATNANNIAAILRTNPKPSIAPLEAASTILDESSFTISISSLTFASLISGIIILEIISPAGADIKLADTKYSIGIPNNEYPTNIDPETEASPPTITVNNSDSVNFSTYGLINNGASVCPKNIFAADDIVSSLEVPKSFDNPPPISFITNCITPK